MSSPDGHLLVLAFLPQHVWEVGAGVFAILIGANGIYSLARSREVARRERLNERTVMAFGLIQTGLGLGIGIAALTVDAEPPGGLHGGGGWGGTIGIAFLCIWVLAMCSWPASRMIRGLRDKSDRGR